MPYRQPNFVAGSFYHIYNRGVSKRDIFKETKDYQRFMDKLENYSEEFKSEILCYCLMPNHFHILIQQTAEVSISNLIQKLCLSYAMYFNIKYQNVGPVFQGRFKSKLIDREEYLLHLSRYIHQNPWELVALERRSSLKSRSFLKNYPWSSYRYYLDKRKKFWVNTKIISSYFSKENPNLSYQDFVESSLLAGEIEKLKPYLIEV